MSPRTSKTGLHLPSLSVKGLRGIVDLSIRRLGRVTLIAGKNGVGKTTVLDAIRIYASRGSNSVLTSILENREESIAVNDEDRREIVAPDYVALFHGRRHSIDSCISIGPIGAKGRAQQLTIKLNPKLLQEELPFYEEHLSSDETLYNIKFQGTSRKVSVGSTFRGPRFLARRFRDDELQPSSDIRCLVLGPGLPSSYDMARFWDSVALTENESRALKALQLIYTGQITRVAVVDDSRRVRSGRRVLVKVNGQDRPVPLKSLGDAAVRLFGVALALANSHDGFLLIDEAENGIHHSVQYAFWKMVIETAHENNVQVLATTHSWDCVAGFAQAATDSAEVEGALVRLETNGDGIRAVEYSEEELRVVAGQGIEVR